VKIKLFAIGIVITIFLTTGCTTQRINQFETFAKAGKGYSDAIDALTIEAGNAAIDTDSQLLIKDRKRLPEPDRKEIIVARNKALKDLVAELRKFNKHSRLLRRYFSALEKLAISDASTGITENAVKLVDELQKINPDLKNATIGEASVNDFVTQAVPLVVAAFQQAALEKELKKNAKTIERELDLQHAFLAALADGLEADLEAVLKIRAYEEVAKPYIRAGNLPENWADTRREIITTTVMLGSVDNAQKAAKSLQEAFIALV
jgi:hypothetical protein